MLNDASKNAMLTAWKPLYPYIGLLNDSDVELSGGTPAYARKAAAWTVPTTGSIAIGGPLTFDIPAGAVVSKVAYFSAITGGTQGGVFDSGPINETFAGQGNYVLDSGDIQLNN